MLDGPEITFLFTDIEGSSSMWEHHPAEMPAAIALHDAIIRRAVAHCGGEIFSASGDGFCAAFAGAGDAVRCAVMAQLEIRRARWPTGIGGLAVRIALHTGEAWCQNGGYLGPPLNRCSRILATAHGGQILVSERTACAVNGALPPDVALKDLGECQLRDLIHPEHPYQVLHPDLPADFGPLRGLDAFPNNLPIQPTSFVGRVQELREISGLLRNNRLLTLTGAGGVGKSRLAAQVGADLLHEFPDGVWLAELAPLTDAAEIPEALQFLLSLHDAPGGPTLRAIVQHLRPRRTLLILDNCEHIIEGVASLVVELLRSCPNLVLLATSREPLDVPGEIVWRVSPLRVPHLPWDEIDEHGALEAMASCEATQLLAERLWAQTSAAGVHATDAVAVVHICQRLDGIPLALELVAPWARTIPLCEIAERLDNQLSFLNRGPRTADARQKTLRGAMDWSYDLLSEQERALLRRLSVFSGGWTLEAAEFVTSDPDVIRGLIKRDEVLGLLGELVSRSLVEVDPCRDNMRYGLLEPVRQYAAERLEEAGEADDLRRRHRDYYLALAETTGCMPLETTADRPPEVDIGEAVVKLQPETANLRSALEWSLSVGDYDGAARTGTAGYWQWYGWYPYGLVGGWASRILVGLKERSLFLKTRMLLASAHLAVMRGDRSNAEKRAYQALETADMIGDRLGKGYALLALGVQAWRGGNYVEAEELLRHSLEHGTSLGDYFCTIYSLNTLGNVYVYQGRYSEGEARHREALRYAQQHHDPRCIAWAYLDLGLIARCTGDYGRADELYKQGMDIAKPKERMVIAYAHNMMADLARLRGDPTGAMDHVAQALRIFRHLEDAPEIATALETAAKTCTSLGEPAKAARLCGAAAALRESCGAPIPPILRAEWDECIAAVRGTMGDDAFTREWEQGNTMDTRAAIAYALGIASRLR
ncbi:MAG: tetratricopeptide repeat protein [Armatimonadetes bacterium]|nr:tetratricopeptide repeat protein [Armatimonadota bacterium]